MRRPHSLRSRLFRWFFGAILLAMLTSALVVSTTRPEQISGAEALAHNVSERLASGWDDPDATRAFLGEVRDVTGFDVRLVRDPRKLPGHVRRVADRGGSIAPDGAEHIFVPVLRNGRLQGALEMQKFGPRPMAWAWWRFALAFFLVVSALSAMAGGVANQLARPLEHLAHAADRIGGGDLAFRTNLAGGRRRWVAQEVREVAVSFNRMADRIEAMVRGQRELLGAISHELRSPMGRARVALEIARDRLPPPSSESLQRSPLAALDDVEKQLGAVDAILGDLLDVARTGLSDLRTERRPLVEWLEVRIAEEPTPPAIALAAGPDERELVLAFDAALLARAFQNLLVNARAHGHPAERPIEVRVSREGESARVVVRDRGPGFSPGFAERAFDPFVRGDPARARLAAGPGYGLGLTLVRRIVEAHGGHVFARNADGGEGGEGGEGSEGGKGGKGGKGAEVGFELPLAPPAG
ncbi:MAG TPA: HAMP domain-containing sensor histidine kinase [Polyangiaceae bacterium]|nr:HAMP domain-containing sensor histidine kinase [Polyangiaceae bacterium]